MTHMQSEKGSPDERNTADPLESASSSGSAESSIEATHRSESSSGSRAGSRAGAGIDVHGDGVDSIEASKDVGGDGKNRLQRSMFLWELGQRDSGCWLVTSIMPVSLL